MKNVFLLALMISVQSAFAVKADDVPITPSKPIEARMEPMGITSKGFRLGISKGLVDGSINLTTARIENQYGVSVGYAFIPTEDFGFLGHVTYSEYKQTYGGSDSFSHAVRVDANATYSFKENVYGFAGLNINQFVNGGDAGASDGKAKLGGQLGAGFQLNTMFGLDVQYVWTNVNGSGDNYRVHGIDFVLHATF